EDSMLSEDDMLSENGMLSEDDMLSEGKNDILSEEDILSEDDIMSEDYVLSEDDELSEDYVLSEDDVLNENDLLSENDVLSENNSDREIVDEPLSNEKMPHIDGEFTPYFSNLTEAKMFCWVQKHSITTQAYDDLANIISHPQFKKEDVIKNIRRFREYRQRLPLLPIKSHQIHISSKQTPSTSRNIKKAYCLFICDIIWYALNNPSTFNKMYFDPGQEVTNNYELWHGTIWKESSRFGQESVIIGNVKYHSGDFIIYRESTTKRIGRILSIVQKEGILKINIQRILTFKELPKSMQSKNRKERSIGGEVWMLDREMDNATVITELQAIIKSEMKDFEKGKIMNVQGTVSLVFASLGDITSDLPQGNYMVGVKKHNATRGCHTCNLMKHCWTSDNIYKLQQHLGITRNDFALRSWLECWIVVSKTMTISFKKYFTEEDYNKLRECLEHERKILVQVFN
ncbi:5502_t:CDS:2, partial [Cetraspora pellucida]